MIVDAVIIARGGSKGIPGKNIMDFCGKPLLAWSIQQCQNSKNIRDIWVSSDSNSILSVAEEYNAKIIKRPSEIAGDHATSEVAWLHAIDTIEQNNELADVILAPQVTSPLRETSDIDRAIMLFNDEQYDSMFSCCVAEDLLFWEKNTTGSLKSINYDYLNRKRRQDMPKQYIENGSFYLFTPEVLKNNNNRFGDNVGCVEMEFWKLFEIDNLDDVKMCSALMKEFVL